MARIDGKYDELRELSSAGAETLLEVRSPEGETLRLGWFDVSTPAARASFHRYRAALKSLEPAGLADVVARPGAYYSLWRPVEGAPLAAFLEQPTRDADAVESLRALAERLAAQGYALEDAEIVMDAQGPQIARLVPVDRTPEEAAQLSAPVLAQAGGGRLRRRRSPRPASPLTLWGVLPGLVFLGGALYLGANAARAYLNPNVPTVQAVVGKGAQQAAEVLVEDGYRVAFADGESSDAPLGTVIGQNPEARTALPSGRLVTLIVNNPPPLTVPKLEDLTLDQARAALAENRLGVGTVVTVDGGVTDTPKGRVIAQQPEAGATIARGQRVRLMVSSGVRARQTWLPDLSGLSYPDALALVRKADLVVARLENRTSEQPENSVLAQDPKPYAKVDIGSAVTLTLARAPEAAPAESVPSLPLAPDPSAPEPSTPDASTPDPSAPDASAPDPTTDPSTPDASAPDAAPEGTPNGGPAATPDAAAPPEAAPDAAPAPTGDAAPRTIDLDYAFPDSLPDGNVDIVVRDLDGERVVLSPQPTSVVTGTRAQGPVQVRGPATFVVRVDGQDVTRFDR